MISFLYRSLPIRSLFFLLILLLPDQPGHASEKELVITPAMQYEYAVKLLNEKDYSAARVEFRRFLHFFPDSKDADRARFNMALCMFEMKEYYEAAKIFNTIILADSPDPVTGEAYFYQSRAFEKMGNMGYAQIVLQNFLKLAEDTPTRDRIHLSLGRIFLAEAADSVPGSLGKAKQAIMSISDSGAAAYGIEQYLDLIDQAERAPKKDPVLAGTLSIIPGGGFAYCGRYKDALTTLLINAGLMAATFKAWEDGNKPLAGVIGFVETGFYTGNIYGSISSAHKHNRAQTVKILSQTLSIKPALGHDEYGLLFDFEF
ncbi:tetratricopeptide repeat protein [Desulfospira joergensenii]|uniref:tetratricopeptide repeat protein n=1 Tax=Desulfospira joergensenii TaxID=53329 RepID=UPI0003B61620|nr:tetratricopeptide repeat protein [Desulfospira joergensenii]